MIKLKNLIKEDRSKDSVDRGCLMAYVSPKQQNLLVEFGKALVPDNILYKEGDEFGRESESHVTIRYGFTIDLTKEQVQEIIKGLKIFTVKAKSITLFKDTKNKGYDVVKFDIESSLLNKLNKETKKFPNEETFPDYHPHLTIAYVKAGKFKNESKKLAIELPIDEIVYSPMKGEQMHFKLSND